MCVVISCSKRSGCDKDVSFYRIPKVVSHRGKQEYEMTKNGELVFSRRYPGISVVVVFSKTNEFALDISYRESRPICMMKLTQTGCQLYILAIQRNSQAVKVLPVKDGQGERLEKKLQKQ